MSRTVLRKMSRVLLIAFLASLGAWMFNVERLAHELSDEIAAISVAHDDSHGPVHSPVGGVPPADDSGHQLLHTAAHIQPCPLAEFDWPSQPRSGLTQGAFVVPAVMAVTRDTPFRPPRIPSSMI